MTTDELPIVDVPGGTELLRVVRAPNGNLYVNLRMTPDMADPGLWGILLVDVARNYANAAVAEGISGVGPQGTKQLTREEVLERVKDLFEQEWDNPTDKPQMLETKTQ